MSGPLSSPCWLWLGHVNPNGYPQRWIDGRRHIVSRAVVAATQAIGADEHAHHRCENKLCVNPAHLEVLSPEAHSREHNGDLALDAALAVLAEHPRVAPSVIARWTGHTKSAVQLALWRAERSGRVVRVARGEYELVEISA